MLFFASLFAGPTSFFVLVLFLLLRNNWSVDPDEQNDKIFKTRSASRKRSVAGSKNERVCVSIKWLVQDATFDQADETYLQERLALALPKWQVFKMNW